ncbi:MAG: hypothetical protein PVF58_05210 [Candidatus Methanofastidiosia archaeon]
MNANKRSLKIFVIAVLLGIMVFRVFSLDKTIWFCIESANPVNAQEDAIIFYDDFESYTVEQYPSKTWTNMYDGASAEISSEQYYSPNKSFKLSAYSNWCRTDYIYMGYMDKFYYEAKLYADNKTVGMGFMIPRGDFNPSFNKIRFSNNGNIYFGGQLIQSFSRKRWYTVRVYIDYSSLTADVYIDGVKKGENIEIYPYSFHDDRWGDVVLDRFCLNVPNFDYGIGTAYFDDVLIAEISSSVETDSDTDGDGVTDDRDTCYNPGCNLVDSGGCPLDSDGDSINNCEDNCPYDTGTQSNGCPSTKLQLPDFFLFSCTLLALIIIIVAVIKKKRKKPVYEDTQTYDDETRIY